MGVWGVVWPHAGDKAEERSGDLVDYASAPLGVIDDPRLEQHNGAR